IHRAERTVLAVSADDEKLGWFARYLGAEDVRVLSAASLDVARMQIAAQVPDCVIVDAAIAPPFDDTVVDDASMPDALPVIVYGTPAGGLDPALSRGLAKMPIVREARSPGPLLDLASFFLHRA